MRTEFEYWEQLDVGGRTVSPGGDPAEASDCEIYGRAAIAAADGMAAGLRGHGV